MTTDLSKPGELQHEFRRIVEECLEDSKAAVHLEIFDGYDLEHFQFSVVVPNTEPPSEEPKKKYWFSRKREYSPFMRVLSIYRFGLEQPFSEGCWHSLSIRVYDTEWITVAEKIARTYSKKTGSQCGLVLPF
jgi:hypothetical protein